MANQTKWAKEIIAWAGGAEIEQFHHSFTEGKWENFNGYWGDFEGEWEFRIKPQPKEPQYLYVYEGYGKQEFSRMKTDTISCQIGDRLVAIPYMGKIRLEADDV